ncbi:hypothetical protein BC940DRAFT_290668 [Gongronella butleri]|nr:hypothetical protein BC940DRAFT_290668 [Gongronella butleri]
MGIRGLSSFVQNHTSLGDQKQWRSGEEHRDHLVFDGNAFVYHFAGLHNSHWTHGGKNDRSNDLLRTDREREKRGGKKREGDEQGPIGSFFIFFPSFFRFSFLTGQYSDLIERIQHVLHELQGASLALTFVFDGALPHSKFTTRKKRYGSYIERSASIMSHLSTINQSNKGDAWALGPQYRPDQFLIPPLAMEACLQAIRGVQGVRVLISQGEADMSLAQLAHRVQGYVVSKDSDMHVVPACGRGYIPIDALSIENEVIKATTYRPDALAALLQLPSPAMLPVLGSLVGNDYVTGPAVASAVLRAWADLHPGQKPRPGQLHVPKYAADLLNHVANRDLGATNGPEKLIPSVMVLLTPFLPASHDAADVLATIYHSILVYDPSSPYVPAHVQRPADQPAFFDENGNQGRKLPPSRLVQDVLSTQTFWASVFLEDLQQPTASVISQPLRHALYAWLRVDRVAEHVRERQHLACVSTDTPLNRFNVSVQPRDFYFTAHNTTPPFATSSYPYFASVVMCLRFYIINASHLGRPLANHEVVALIVATLAAAAAPEDLPMALRASLTGPVIPSLKKRSIHVAAEWQQILLHSYTLGSALGCCNAALGARAAVRIDLAAMYNGLHVHLCLQMGRLGASIGRMLDGAAPALAQQFDDVYRAAVLAEHLDARITRIFDYKFSDKPSKPWLKSRILSKQDPAATSSIAPPAPGGNSTKKKKDKRVKTTASASAPAAAAANPFNILSFGCQFE